MSLRAAEAFFDADNIAAARQAAIAVLKEDETSAGARYLLFRCALADGDRPKAEEMVRRWLAVQPDEWLAHRARALVEINGHPRRARRVLADLQRRFPAERGEVLLLEGLRLVKLQKGRRALKALAEARAAGVNDDRVDAIERDARYDRDMPGFSARNAKRALAKAPDDSDAVWTYAMSLFFSGRVFAARRQMRRTRAMDPERRRYYSYYIALTWLVLLPNFAVAHASFLVLLVFASLPTWIGIFVILPAIYVVIVLLVFAGTALEAVGIENGVFVFVLSLPVWYVLLLTGTFLGRWRERGEVQLKKDY